MSLQNVHERDSWRRGDSRCFGRCDVLPQPRKALQFLHGERRSQFTRQRLFGRSADSADGGVIRHKVSSAGGCGALCISNHALIRTLAASRVGIPKQALTALPTPAAVIKALFGINVERIAHAHSGNDNREPDEFAVPSLRPLFRPERGRLVGWVFGCSFWVLCSLNGRFHFENG
jgi:hypothetical protein